MSAWLSVYRSAARSLVQQQPFHQLSVRPVVGKQSSGLVKIIGAENCQWEQCPLWWRVPWCAVAVCSPSVVISLMVCVSEILTRVNGVFSWTLLALVTSFPLSAGLMAKQQLFVGGPITGQSSRHGKRTCTKGLSVHLLASYSEGSLVQQQPFHQLSVRPVVGKQSSGLVKIIGAENCQWEQCPLWWRVPWCAVAVCSPSVVISLMVCVSEILTRVNGVFSWTLLALVTSFPLWSFSWETPPYNMVPSWHFEAEASSLNEGADLGSGTSIRRLYVLLGEKLNLLCTVRALDAYVSTDLPCGGNQNNYLCVLGHPGKGVPRLSRE
ncbi:hypothetical protein F2P79_022621 [Pimephales promelas]|nr:hypothetical protein F2P79_022621 [Pimephales promelas]